MKTLKNPFLGKGLPEQSGLADGSVSQDVAAAAGLEARRGGIPVRITTANGPINASISSAESLSFGNVEARGIDVVIAPNLGDTSVVGMNLLSRLKSWRVEDNTLILVPNNPQPTVEFAR